MWPWGPEPEQRNLNDSIRELKVGVNYLGYELKTETASLRTDTENTTIGPIAVNWMETGIDLIRYNFSK